jgi:hypothetical protein
MTIIKLISFESFIDYFVSLAKLIVWIGAIVLINFVYVGCSDGTIPACRGSYTERVDAKAISELMNEFRVTIALVREEKNDILMSEIMGLKKSRNLRGIEEWVCRAQKTYGKP